MASVTLSADTLWSEIAATVDTDGDQVDLNGFTLTIDQSVIPNVKFMIDGGGKIFCENTSTTDIITINSYYVPFYPYANAKVEIRGQLIDYATVVDGIADEVITPSITIPAKPRCLYLKGEDRWLFEHDIANGLAPIKEADTRKLPEYTFDATANTLTLSHYVPSAGDIFQIPNIIIHSNWATGTAPTFRIINYSELYLQGVMIYEFGAMDGLPTVPYKIIDSGLLLRGYTPSIFSKSGTEFINCAFGGISTSYLGFDIRRWNDGLYCDRITLYPYAYIGQLEKCTFKNVYFRGEYISYPAFIERVNSCSFIGGEYWYVYRSGSSSDLLFDGCKFIANLPTGSYSNLVHMKNITLENYGSAPLSGNPAYESPKWVLTDTTIDINISPSAYLMNNYGHKDTWMLNTKVINRTSLKSESITAREGPIEMLSINAPLDQFRNYNYSSSIFAADFYAYDASYNTNHRSFDVTLLAYDPNSTVGTWQLINSAGKNMEFIIEKSSGISHDGTVVRAANIGDYFILDVFGDRWFITEIGSFTNSYISLSSFDVEFSPDRMKNWYPVDQLVGFSLPNPLKLYFKFTATAANAYYYYMKIDYDRNQNFVNYKSFWYEINVSLIGVPDFHNISWNIAGRQQEDIASTSTTSIIIRYRDVDEIGYAVVRKYGWSFETIQVNISKTRNISGIYLGAQKTDLTLTEAEAAAIVGITFQASADIDYTWELDCGGGTLEDAYHYIQYKLTNFGDLAGIDTFEIDEFLQRDGDMFKTVWARQNEGVKLINYTGKVSGMMKDDGTIYVPPTTILFTFSLSPAITNYEYRIYQVNNLGSLSGAIELQGEEVATSSTITYSYEYTGTDIPIAVQIISQPDNDYVESVTYYTLSNADQNVLITLEEDINN